MLNRGRRRRIYVASSWRNQFQPFVVAFLRNLGHEVYDFRHPSADDDGFRWSEVDPRWQDWTPAIYRDALGDAISEQGFQNDWQAMEWADTCVLVLPCGRSAHIEAGYFIGAGKELYILMLEKQEPELMYKMATAICIEFGELVGRLGVATAETASR